MEQEINIRPAKDGGYVVLGFLGRGMDKELLYAGTLRECLEYIRAHFEDGTAT